VGGNKQKTGQPATSESKSLPDEQKKELAGSSQDPRLEKPAKGYIVWTLLFLFLGILSIYFVYRYLRKKTGLKTTSNKVKEPRISNRQILTKLQQACNNNDNAEAAKQLLRLAKNQWAENPPKSLGALAKRLASGTQLIKELDESLYAVSKGGDGSLFSLVWDEFKQGLKPIEDNTSSNNDGLAASLYPNR